MLYCIKKHNELNLWFHCVAVSTPALQAESLGFYSQRNHMYIMAPVSGVN